MDNERTLKLLESDVVVINGKLYAKGQKIGDAVFFKEYDNPGDDLYADYTFGIEIEEVVQGEISTPTSLRTKHGNILRFLKFEQI